MSRHKQGKAWRMPGCRRTEGRAELSRERIVNSTVQGDCWEEIPVDWGSRGESVSEKSIEELTREEASLKHLLHQTAWVPHVKVRAEFSCFSSPLAQTCFSEKAQKRLMKLSNFPSLFQAFSSSASPSQEMEDTHTEIDHVAQLHSR